MRVLLYTITLTKIFKAGPWPAKAKFCHGCPFAKVALVVVALATTCAPCQGCLGKGASMALVLIYIK